MKQIRQHSTLKRRALLMQNFPNASEDALSAMSNEGCPTNIRQPYPLQTTANPNGCPLVCSLCRH